LANSRAAFMGPTVWELEGPMPTLNKSNTLIDTAVFLCLYIRGAYRRSKGRATVKSAAE